MKIIKRSGMEDTFDIKKIEAAIRKANESVIDYEKLTEEKIQEILANVGMEACASGRRFCRLH
jgi:ribonucleoside-triphosphate reductase (formate)